MKIQKFLFAHSFDVNLPQAPGYGVGDGARVETVSEEEMVRSVELSRERGYAQGLEEGIARGHALANQAIEKTVQEALSQISLELTRIAATAMDRSARLVPEVVMLTREILQKLFPLLEQCFSVYESQTLIDTILKTQTPPFLKIATHPDVRPKLESRLRSLRTSVPFVFEESAPVHPSSYCKVEWHESGVEWAAGEILEKIQTLLKGFENILDKSTGRGSVENLKTVSQA